MQYVDAHKLFADSDGTFSYDLPDETGKVVTMRAGDGVHFTMDGADYLARTVYKLVDAQCAVTAQKVDGRDEADHRDRGQHPGRTGLGASSGSGSSSGSGLLRRLRLGLLLRRLGSSAATVATTPPAPAPVTDPPITAPRPRPRPRHRRRIRRRRHPLGATTPSQ